MRRLSWLGAGMGVVVGLATLGTGAPALVQDDAEQYITKPTKEHRVLRESLGVWDAEVKAWMPGVEEPTTSQGTETNRPMGGLWVVSDFRGEFGGQPFRGHGVTGYDTQKEKYVGNWVDSMTSQMMTMEGTYDAATKTLTMHGESYDPVSKSAMKLKQVAVDHGDGTRTFTMYMEAPEAGGEPIKMMEIAYKKRADLPAGKNKGASKKN